MIDIDREQVERLEQRLRGANFDRRRFLKIAGAAATAPIAASLLAACGGDDDDPTATAAPAEPTATTGGQAEPTATTAMAEPTATEAAAGEPTATEAAAGEPTATEAAAGGDAEQVFYDSYHTLNPTSHDFNANLYCNGVAALWSGLLTFDADLLPVADWAETWESNDDGSMWTFNIRPDNTGFSNGDPVTAEIFDFSWKRMLDPETAAPYASIIFDIKNAEAVNLEGADPATLGTTVVDDWTFQVEMEGPRGLFPTIVGYIACVPCHPPSVEEWGIDWTDPNVTGEPIVSNGPFTLVAWEHDVMLEYVKNPNHWDAENVRLEQVFEPIIPAEQGLLPYEAGDVDWALVPGPDMTRVQDDPQMSTELVLYVEPGVWFLLPAVDIAPFDDIGVRRALQHVIDRDRIITVTNGLGAPAFGLMPPGLFGYFDDPQFVENHTFDVEQGIAELEGTPYAGGENWPAIEISLRQEQLNSAIMAEDIAAQLTENLGMDISVNIMERNAFYDTLYQGNLQLTFIRWFYDYPDPNNGYFDMFYSRKVSGKRQQWANDEFDELTIAGKEAVDPDERLEIYRQCETIMQEDVCYVPTTYMINPYIFKPWVKGLPVNAQGFTVPNGNIYVNMLSDIYVEGREA